jgi:uronate dehydrogenase
VGRQQHVLLTGSAGGIGSTVGPHLIARGHKVRAFDRRATPWADDQVVADLTEPVALAAAMAGVDTVLHLAACPGNGDFIEALLKPNVIGVHHVFEQARQANVRRMVIASSCQTVHHRAWNASSGKLRLEDGPSVNNHYALTKVWAEETGRLYANISDMQVIAVRLGWFIKRPGEFGHAHRVPMTANSYLSQGDCCDLFTRCVEIEPLNEQFAVIFGMSKQHGEPYYDLEPARRLLGYEPTDRYPADAPTSG